MTERGELLLYLGVGVAYIAVGVVAPELIWSWVEGVAFLLLGVWILPSLVRRVRRR